MFDTHLHAILSLRILHVYYIFHSSVLPLILYNITVSNWKEFMEIVCICSQFILQKLFFMELHTVAELCNLNIQRYVCISLMFENDC